MKSYEKSLGNMIVQTFCLAEVFQGFIMFSLGSISTPPIGVGLSIPRVYLYGLAAVVGDSKGRGASEGED